MKSIKEIDLMQEYKEIKKMFDLPLKMKLFFSILEGLTQENSPSKSKISGQKLIDENLVKSFSKQSYDEKCYYLLEMIRFIKMQYEKEDHKTQRLELYPEEAKSPTAINNIQTTCQMETKVIKMSHWINVKFKFDKLRRAIAIAGKKKNFTLNLDQYLARKSKKHNSTLVLESISKEVSEQYSKVELFFREEIFQKIYIEVLKSVTQSRNDFLLSMMKQKEEEEMTDEAYNTNTNPLTQQESLNNKSLILLSSEKLTEYLKFKDMIYKRMLVNKFDFKNISTKSIDGEIVKIDRSLKIDKLFKLECIINQPAKLIKDTFLESANKKFKYLLNTQVLQQFSKKYKAVFDRFLINNKVQQLLCIKEETNSEKDEILFIQGIDNIMTQSYLQFLIVKVKETQEKKCKLLIVASLLLNPVLTIEVAIAYLTQYREMLNRNNKNLKEDELHDSFDDQDQFFSIRSGDEGENVVQLRIDTEFYDEELESPGFNAMMLKKSSNKQGTLLKVKSINSKNEEVGRVNQNYLKERFLIDPLDDVIPKRTMKEHYMFKDWVRCKNGGVLCLDENIVNEQKKVYKKLITMIGSSIHKMFKSGNVLSLSLPVTIFKKQSHLECLSFNFGYAPLLLERQFEDPVERLKYCVIFAFSTCNLAINSEKPFNPILGETHQAWVDGCPIYIEQVSHHPPISSYMFYGRGYKVYGTVQPKISLNIYCAKGYSDRLAYIQFDDGSVIACSLGAKMYITGVLFGDREFHYEDKMFCYDMKNHYFADIELGPRKKGFISKGDPADFFHGKICRTTSAYTAKFKEKVPPIFPVKDYLVKEHSQIEGIWNESIRFDGKQYYNLTTNTPCIMSSEKYPLPSDSIYREDLQELIAGRVDKSQEQKERMEEAQRKDKKLRQFWSKKLEEKGKK